MKIRERLIIAFLIIINIPIFMIAAVGGVIINHQVNSIQQSYDVETNTIQILISPIQIFNRLTKNTCQEITKKAGRSPDSFRDVKYLDRLNQELSENYSYLVIRENSLFTYIGDIEMFGMVEASLPSFGSDSMKVDGGIFVNGDNPLLVKQQDFYFTNGSRGSAFIITDMTTVLPQIQESVYQLVGSFILIMCFTAVILVWWIYQGMIRPLNQLRIATIQMQHGNLDYEVRPVNNDEIGELSQEFDEMRRRLKHLMEERLQYEEDSRELISNISHDLKTPLTAIKGYAEGILDGVADTPEKQAKYLRTIYTKASDMAVLVDELSIYSKIDNNSIPYHFITLNLNDYFMDCIEELSLDLEMKQIDVGYFNYTNHGLQVIADAEQLKRVINNIVGNSVKYMDKERGLINIRVDDGGDFVKVAIGDNGKGIQPGEEAHLFERFYRTDASRNSSKGGSGLGLAICKKIIEDHGGMIWASGKPGEGTVIYFTLRKNLPPAKDMLRLAP